MLAYWNYSRFYVCVCWINICQIQINMSISTQIKNKNEQTNKLKRKKKQMKCYMYWTRTHIFWVQRTASYPLSYQGIVIFLVHQSYLPQSKAHILRRLPTIGRKVISHAYVSGHCRQTIISCIVAFSTRVQCFVMRNSMNFLSIYGVESRDFGAIIVPQGNK